MPMRLYKATLTLILPLVCSRLSLAGDQQWVEVRSPNFSVITDAGERRGRDVALHFEQMRSVFGTLMTRANVNLPVPLQIVAFRSTKEIRQIAPMFNGKPTELAGLFQSGDDRNFIMLDMSVENPWYTVFHEYAHELMNGNISVRSDPWFEEGFAEYFAGIEVDSKEARVGKIPEQTYQVLQYSGFLKTADLLRVQQYSKTYNETGDHRNSFYAQSSLMVHYIYDNQLLPKVAEYFDALHFDKKTVEQAFQGAFGMSLEQFDKVLRQYYTGGRYRYYPIPTPPGIQAAQFTATPVTLADARAVLADIHAHSMDHRGQALGEFEDVLKTDPNNAAALRGAGYSCLMAQDFDKAADYFQRAVARDSKDARVHYYYAMLMSRQGSVGDKARTDELKKELETAIALDPKLADAYSLLGYAQVYSGEPEKGLATMKLAVELSPRNEGYQFNLASAYLGNNKVDEAIAIFQALAASSNPEVATHASAALRQAQDFKKRGLEFRMEAESSDSGTPEPHNKLEPPGLVARSTTADTSSDTATTVVTLPPSAPIHFLKGKLKSVDCSAGPQGVLILASGSKTLKLYVKDTAHVIIIGADQFSCDWKGISVAVNYREREDGDGDVVSVEVQ